MLDTILIVLALLCEVLATFGVSAKVNLMAAGLAFYFLSLLI